MARGESGVTVLTLDRFQTPEETGEFAFYGRTVYFESATALNYYVTVKSGSIGSVECTGGKKTEVKLYKDNIYIVSVKDILATELDETFTVTLDGNFRISGSVLDYCSAVYRSHYNENEEQITAKDRFALDSMAAFYEYHKAAKTYFGE